MHAWGTHTLTARLPIPVVGNRRIEAGVMPCAAKTQTPMS
jgi:hypothetical protein